MSLKKEVRGNDILADDKSVSLGTKGTALGRIFLIFEPQHAQIYQKG
jgi:hypothetical protein